MNPYQLRALIRRELDTVELGGRAPVELLMLTAAQETHLGKYIRQLGDGPARGIFQIEPATEKLVLKWALENRENLFWELVKRNSGSPLDLEANLRYQIVLARVNYLSWPAALPSVERNSDLSASSVRALAEYWKAYWNTEHGAGTPEEAVKNYEELAR